MNLLQEWDHQTGRILRAMLQGDQRNCDENACGDLVAKLGASREPGIAAVHNLKVVIGETDGSEGQGGEDGNPDEGISQVCPEQCRNQDGDGNQQSAHSRRAGFFLMSLRSLFSYVLTNLKVAQPPDNDRADDESREKRGEAGEGRAKCQV